MTNQGTIEIYYCRIFALYLRWYTLQKYPVNLYNQLKRKHKKRKKGCGTGRKMENNYQVARI